MQHLWLWNRSSGRCWGRPRGRRGSHWLLLLVRSMICAASGIWQARCEFFAYRVQGSPRANSEILESRVILLSRDLPLLNRSAFSHRSAGTLERFHVRWKRSISLYRRKYGVKDGICNSIFFGIRSKFADGQAIAGWSSGGADRISGRPERLPAQHL